jgi:histidinol-phosphate phosphatase family protein
VKPGPNEQGRPAVFVDRDGTLIEDVPYNHDPEQVRVFPGVRDALQRLRAAGYLIVMATNQSAIGRGWATIADFDLVQARLLELLGHDAFDAIEMCHDAPDEPSERRKPEPGMILDAARKLGIELKRSWMIGDKASDIECGIRAGVRSLQVGTGEGEAQRTTKALYFAPDFTEAVRFILDAHETGC